MDGTARGGAEGWMQSFGGGGGRQDRQGKLEEGRSTAYLKIRCQLGKGIIYIHTYNNIIYLYFLYIINKKIEYNTFLLINYGYPPA